MSGRSGSEGEGKEGRENGMKEVCVVEEEGGWWCEDNGGAGLMIWKAA